MKATVSLESILDMLQSLSNDNKRWLAEKLIESANEEQLRPYTMDELNARIDEAEAELEAGEPGYTPEEFDVQTRKSTAPHPQKH